MNTIEFTKLLQDTNLIYEPMDYLMKTKSASVEEIHSFIDSIKEQYLELIQVKLKKSLNNFQYEWRNCSAYSNKFLTMPIFWQEIIVLIYMSLKLYKHVDNNSRIICLGESPLKLVFIQQVLNTLPQINKILESNGFGYNIQYTYLPLSQLSSFIDPNVWIWGEADIQLSDDKIEFNYDKFIQMGIDEVDKDVNHSILKYFMLFKLDPISIIRNDNKTYYEDRAEKYKTIFNLIFIYNKLCDIQKLNLEQRLSLYNKLWIIGFDMKNNEFLEYDALIMSRLNNIYFKIITKQTEMIEPHQYHLIKVNFNYNKTEIEDCIKDDFNLFTNQVNTIGKMLTFLTIPEKTFNNSRCIISCSLKEKCKEKILKDFERNNILYLKQEGKSGYNCNIINLCVMIFILDLGTQYIRNIIENLDNITDDIFINHMDFNDINRTIVGIVSNRTYNNNILSNNSNNKWSIDEINDEITTFLHDHGLFSSCTYKLPLRE